jgi:quinol monooxygenase YgiN
VHTDTTEPGNLFIVARISARAGNESALTQAIEDVAAPTRAEPGCLDFRAFRATRDPALFFIHSRWRDEAAFDHHAELPHTVRFLATVQPLIGHPLDVARTRRII